MDKGKMFLSLLISLVAVVIVIAAMYFLGSVIEERFWVKGIKLAEWQSLYMKVLLATGACVFISCAIWIVRTFTMNTLTANGQADPRPMWIGLFVLSIAEALIIPFICSATGYIPHLHIINIAVGAILMVLAFYFTTVFGTPDKFKYAPLGASSLRG